MTQLKKKMEKELPVANDKVIPAVPAEPEPACEKEVQGYTDDFTLSGGCCGG